MFKVPDNLDLSDDEEDPPLSDSQTTLAPAVQIVAPNFGANLQYDPSPAESEDDAGQFDRRTSQPTLQPFLMAPSRQEEVDLAMLCHVELP